MRLPLFGWWARRGQDTTGTLWTVHLRECPFIKWVTYEVLPVHSPQRYLPNAEVLAGLTPLPNISGATALLVHVPSRKRAKAWADKGESPLKWILSDGECAVKPTVWAWTRAGLDVPTSQRLFLIPVPTDVRMATWESVRVQEEMAICYLRQEAGPTLTDSGTDDHGTDDNLPEQ